MGRELFKSNALASLIRAGDSQRFKIDLKLDRLTILSKASSDAASGVLDLANYSSTTVRSKPCITYSDFSTHLLLRAISRHLKRRLRVIMPDRDGIVRGVIETLLDGTPMYVIRRDISSFYESIPIAPLRDKLVYDTASSSLVRRYLQDFFSVHCSGSTCGLPRGIGLSALLAELSMRDFDARMRGIEGVFKYYRFSDDMIIFSTRPPADIEPEIKNALPSTMTFNPQKGGEYFFPPKAKNSIAPLQLEYLGYKFTTEQAGDRGDSRIVRVAIASRKLGKLQSRMIMSYKKFEKDKNWLLLQDRLHFLSGNYRVRRNGANQIKTGTHVFSGVYYNYRLCGRYYTKNLKLRVEQYDCAELMGLDSFYHFITRQYVKAGILTQSQGTALRRNSFHMGFKLKIKARFKPERVGEMKQAWRNV